MSNENKCKFGASDHPDSIILPPKENEKSTILPECHKNPLLETPTRCINENEAVEQKSNSFGEAVKILENESLNSILLYDSESSSSSDLLEHNLNWRMRDGNASDDSTSSSSSSSSSSEENDFDDDDDDDDDDEGELVTSSEDEIEVQVQLQESRGAIKKNTPIKAKGEMSIDDLPPVPDLTKLCINVDNEEFSHMGHILGIVDKLVTVAAIPNTPVFDVDTLLFLEDRQPLGFVFDVLGQVTSPIYAIRFNQVKDIKELRIEPGNKVFSAPKSKHSQYVFLHHLLKAKGSDASWLGDNEVPVEYVDHSDDENEGRQRFGSQKLAPHLKRTHSGDNYKKFETTMNKRNLLNTRFNKYLDTYKQLRAKKIKAQPQIHAVAPTVPVFDPTVPPPNMVQYIPQFQSGTGNSAYQQLQPPPGFIQVVTPRRASGNNNTGIDHTRNLQHMFMNNSVTSLSQTNSANYFTNHAGYNNPGPSHE